MARIATWWRVFSMGPDGTAMIDNTITDHDGPGLFVGGANAWGRIAGGLLHDNAGAGAFIDTGARVEITGASFQANTGPGIDLAPGAVTPNDATKRIAAPAMPMPWDACGAPRTGARAAPAA